MLGRLHSVETLGGLDGPGIRTVFFLAGCNVRCGYCHNPDTFPLDGGRAVDSSELIALASRYRNYYGSTGGITLSGGEPLCQPAFTRDILSRARECGIHTALDTSGTVFAPEVLMAADLVILDIKHTEAAGYELMTQSSIDSVIKTLDFLVKKAIHFWVRQVIISGYNDSVEQVERLAMMARGADLIELLPLHNMAADKWRAMGKPYLYEGKEPLESTMQQLEAIVNRQNTSRS